MSEKESFLKSKHILVVDDEEDILETIEEILETSIVDTARDYNSASQKIKDQKYDLAILDIMGVDGLQLLEETVQREIPTVMLTAHAVTTADIHKSFDQGAAYYIPKQEMANIEVFLNDVLEAIQKGENTWSRRYNRLSRFGERVFGEEWAENQEDLLNKFTFHI